MSALEEEGADISGPQSPVVGLDALHQERGGLHEELD